MLSCIRNDLGYARIKSICSRYSKLGGHLSLLFTKCPTHQSTILTPRRLACRYHCRRRCQLRGCGSLHRGSLAGFVEGYAVDCVRARLCLIFDFVRSQENNSTTSRISFMLKDCKAVSRSRSVPAIDNLHVLD